MSLATLHALVHHKTTTIYRIVRTLRFGTIQERRKKRISIMGNESDTIGIYLSDHMKERKKPREYTRKNT